MAYLFNGATHIISRGDAVLQTWPITLHGRIRMTNPGDGLDHQNDSDARHAGEEGSQPPHDVAPPLWPLPLFFFGLWCFFLGFGLT